MDRKHQSLRQKSPRAKQVSALEFDEARETLDSKCSSDSSYVWNELDFELRCGSTHSVDFGKFGRKWSEPGSANSSGEGIEARVRGVKSKSRWATCRHRKDFELVIIKMLKTTFIARASDGLILCETYDIDTNPQSKIDSNCSWAAQDQS